MRTLILFVFLVILSINTLNAQTKYLDSTRTTVSFLGAGGISENAYSRSLGVTLMIKSSFDIAIQIGSVKNEEDELFDDNFSDIPGDGMGSFVSFQSYLYMLSEARDDKANIAIALSGSTISYNEADLNSFGAGLHFSTRESEDGKISITPSIEILFFLINEAVKKGSGRTTTSKVILFSQLALL